MNYLIKIIRALRDEWRQTKSMAFTYYRLLRYKKQICKKCRDTAKLQLYDIPKFLPFLIILFFPLPGITELYLGFAIVITKLSNGRFLILPSEFNAIVISKKS